MPNHAEMEALPSVLVASRDNDYSGTLLRFLEQSGYGTERCHDTKGVLREIGLRDYQVLVLDLDIVVYESEESSDTDLISFVCRQSPNTQIIIVFDMNDIDRAIEGIHHGAYFYVPKGSQPSDVVLVVDKAVQDLKLRATIMEHEQHQFEELVGNTPAMRRVMELITKVAPTDSTVLLLGESGTGKEVMANMLHRLSPRRDQPFIAINCAALPEQILESELFGHVKGAFTGADSDKVGLFEEADGGTLFLDEIGDMALVSQAKLLRTLQSGDIRRVGDTVSRHVDVRILAATNRNLIEEVNNKDFREDLYFRLNVIQIAIPPLRERPDAINALVKEFLKRFNLRYNKTIFDVEDHAWTLLQNYAYPGNIRELESIIAHAVIMADSSTIRVQDLPDQIRFGQGARLSLPGAAESRIETLQDMEKNMIERALERLNGNQTEVSKSLGISRSTLWQKMKEYDISRSGESSTTSN